MIIIDGKKIARDIIDGLKKMPKPEKSLAAIFVGSSKASESFLKQKEKMAALELPKMSAKKRRGDLY